MGQIELFLGLYNIVWLVIPPPPYPLVAGGVSCGCGEALGVVRYIYVHQLAGYLRERRDHEHQDSRDLHLHWMRA
jgi:hypothetical protein